MSRSWSDLALLLLRVAFGGLMALQHGLSKLDKLMAGNFKFADPLGIGSEASLFLAATAEGICGLLLAVGVATRGAAVPLAFTMFVAVFLQHAGDPLAKRELGLLYLAAYLALIALGPGRYAISTWYQSKLPTKWPHWLRFLLT